MRMLAACDRALLALLAVISSSAPVVARVAPPPSISRPPIVPGATPTLPAPPPAEFDPSLSVGGGDVKARQVETRLGADVLINGQGPFRFIVDSGANTSAVGQGIARKLTLPAGSPVLLNGMTGRSLVNRVRVESMTLGPSTVYNLQLPILREVDMGGAGIIGIDALHEQRLMMDFDQHLIRVEDARTSLKILPGDIVVTARRQRGQLILTEVRASDQRLRAIIDTGSEVTVGNTVLRDKLQRLNWATVRSLEVTGVTGEKVMVQLAVIDELQLGPILLRDVPIAFADLPPFKLFGLADRPALLLGTDILGSFRRISLDFRARKVRFQLRQCTPQAVDISTNADHFSRLSSADGLESCPR